jgi:hypothetical protein
MIRYTIDKETKTIELLGGSSSEEELKDLIEMFEGYSFTVSFSPPNRLEKQGMVVGAAFTPIIGKIEHN